VWGDMSQISSNVGDALFTKTQQRVLGLLYGQPEQSYYLNEIVRLAAVGKGTVKRELEKLCSAGLLTVRRIGNQNHYQANSGNPVFTELKGLIQKTFGLVNIVREALEPLLDQVELAFIYGSVAKGSEHAGSDIDLLLVCKEIEYAAVMEALGPAEKQLGRTINPTLYTPREFAERKGRNHHFVTRVLEQEKLWIKQDADGDL
jgi:predicted nucleotidyltransferase